MTATLAPQLALDGMPARRRFCPARDCDRRCGLTGLPCLCLPCSCQGCAERSKRAASGAAITWPRTAPIFLQPSVPFQTALFVQRPERRKPL